MFLKKNKKLDVSLKGWLYRQLNTQNEGLFGSLDKVWDDIKDSKWIGGKAEGWERFPYYLNGLIPLAYALNDEEMIAKTKKYVYAIMDSQREDGKICPKDDTDNQAGDIWSMFLVLKILAIYGELSDDQKVIDVIKKGLAYVDKAMNGTTIYNWGHARYFECFVPMIFLKNKINSPKYHAFLKELAIKLKSQGLDYKLASSLWDKPHNYWSYDTHGVNIAMALKASCLYKELTGKDDDISAEEMLAILDEKHGTAYGHFTSDECLAGTSPYQGAELCGVVEAMYSYELLFSLTQNPYWLDRLELLAYNGLPATNTDDMWGHQYDQQVNQLACVPLTKKVIFKTNGNEANVFGLEPNYGCCTANFGQGWPLFALSCFERINNGVQINVLASAEIKVDNEKILTIEAEYPFRNKVILEANSNMVVRLRIPGTCYVNKAYKVNNGFVTLRLKANSQKVITLKPKTLLNVRSTGLHTLTYGSLLFSLPIAFETKINEYEKNNVVRKFPYCDYHFIKKGEHRYGFASNKFKVIEKEFDNAFDRNNPPLVIETKMVLLDWKMKKGYEYVLEDTYRKSTNIKEVKELQPYGSTYLRMTEMPSLIKEEK